jgi:dihydrofolate synthase / folylpolyglutamate synthase
MFITTIKTHKIQPRESIFDILNTYITELSENSIIAIASKIISTSENRLLNKDKIKNKLAIIHKESDYCFASPKKQKNFYLTLKNHRLIPNAGIDESNCKNFYLLLPQKPQLTAKKIWEYLQKKHHIKNLGIIITDSNITPIRAGVTGITIGWCGFKPIYSYIGKKDVFGRILKVTQVNLLDSLATTATLTMGEGEEQTPIAIISQPPSNVVFQNRAPTKKEEKETYIAPAKDLFGFITQPYKKTMKQ